MKNEFDNDSIFFKTFVGEFVQVVSAVGQEPIEIYGYLLHADNDYYYLGAGLARIDAAVKKSGVNIIQVDDGLDKVLKDLKKPEAPEGLM